MNVRLVIKWSDFKPIPAVPSAAGQPAAAPAPASPDKP
jgi:hypothetical protein